MNLLVHILGSVPVDESIINVDLTNSRYPDAPEVGEIDFPEDTVDNVQSVLIQYRPSEDAPFQTVEINGQIVIICYFSP